MVWYGILGFNIPLDTVWVISETVQKFIITMSNDVSMFGGYADIWRDGRKDRKNHPTTNTFVFFCSMAYFAGNYSGLDSFLFRGERLVVAGAGFITGSLM